MNYTEFASQIATLAVVAETDPNFQIVLPQAINYAELRMQREIDFLSTVQSNSNFSLIANSRQLTIPESTFVTLQEFNIITPAGTIDPNAGTRNPCLPVTKEFLDNVYGSAVGAAMPKYFAPLNQSIWLFGPWPDANYQLELIGTIRAQTLSVTNPTTFISTYLPDLMIMAAMIYISGYQRNFGKQSDDPSMAVSYESQYQTLKGGAVIEEARKKFQASGWTSMSPPAAATPGR